MLVAWLTAGVAVLGGVLAEPATAGAGGTATQVEITDIQETAGERTRITVREPLPYGHQIGDTWTRELRVYPARGTRLAEAALPKPGRAGKWFALRSIDVDRPGDGSVRLRLEYQVINVPDSVRTVSAPPMSVPIQRGETVVKLAIEPVWLTIGPMTPDTVLGRDQLLDVQADAPAPRIETTTAEQRLRWTLAALVLPLLALAYCWLPWERLWRAPRPFATALRTVRRLRTQPDETFWPAALRALHQALDSTAGATVFPGEIGRLVDQHPGYARIAGELADWLVASRALFFSGQHWPDANRRDELVRLLHNARAIERGIQ